MLDDAISKISADWIQTCKLSTNSRELQATKHQSISGFHKKYWIERILMELVQHKKKLDQNQGMCLRLKQPLNVVKPLMKQNSHYHRFSHVSQSPNDLSNLTVQRGEERNTRKDWKEFLQKLKCSNLLCRTQLIIVWQQNIFSKTNFVMQ